MEDYQSFRDKLGVLEKFTETCETTEIEGTVHLVINDDNVEEFTDIIRDLATVASSEDGFADEVLEYLNDLNRKITDRDMIAKFIPLFAAIECLAAKFPDPNEEIKLDDWVFVRNLFDAPMDERIGKVVGIVPNEIEGLAPTYKIKATLANEYVEFEDVDLVVIPGMPQMMKEYQARYTKIF